MPIKIILENLTTSNPVIFKLYNFCGVMKGQAESRGYEGRSVGNMLQYMYMNDTSHHHIYLIAIIYSSIDYTQACMCVYIRIIIMCTLISCPVYRAPPHPVGYTVTLPFTMKVLGVALLLCVGVLPALGQVAPECTHTRGELGTGNIAVSKLYCSKQQLRAP